MTRAGTLPPQCATHPGFIAGRCARCRPDAVLDVPRSETAKKMRATTSDVARVQRAANEAAAEARKLTHAQRATGFATMRAADVAARRKNAKGPKPKPVRTPKPSGRELFITYRGVTRRLCDWAEVLGVASSTVRDRYSYGVPLDAPRTVGKMAARGSYDYKRDCEVGR